MIGQAATTMTRDRKQVGNLRFTLSTENDEQLFLHENPSKFDRLLLIKSLFLDCRIVIDFVKYFTEYLRMKTYVVMVNS
jgi:hypothetical protein